jgi:hypothetical protein
MGGERRRRKKRRRVCVEVEVEVEWRCGRKQRSDDWRWLSDGMWLRSDP